MLTKRYNDCRMKNRIVTKEDQRKIFLEILDEVDLFCRTNELRYSIAYGTLLGAIRHGGFIPWDDDMDICMPYPDMMRFKELFHSKKIKYCDVDTQKYFDFPFSRVCYLPTFNKRGLIGREYGVNIDLYPVVGCPENDSEVEDFFFESGKILKKRLLINKWRLRTMKLLPIRSIPGFNDINKKYRDFVLQHSYDGSKRYFHMSGSLKWTEVFCYDIFENLIDVDFEGRKYMATSRYDDYLKQIYGDYMTPPPENKRYPYHGGHYFWK